MPKTAKPRRILGGPLRGCSLVTSWRDYPAALLGRTERGLLYWLDRNVGPGETWLDVGAHYGYTAIALSRLVGPTGRVFAFEPVVQTAGCLARTRAVNALRHLTIVPFALGAPDSVSVFLAATVRGMLDSTMELDVRGQPREPVLVARLDWLWPRICGGRGRVHGIKIDVQGMELDALRGMGDLLKSGRPKLVVEFHRHVARDEVLSFLEGCGYDLRADPIDPARGEAGPRFLDDRSYAFAAP